MELKHQCKICNRRFASGKSMGGHMRSHFATLQVPKTSSSLSPESENTSVTIFTPPQLESSKDSLYFNSNSTPLSRVETSSITSQRSAATIGVRASPCKRSKRMSRFTTPKLQTDQMRGKNLYHDTSSSGSLILVEDAAHILMKLSRDKWPEDVKHPLMSNQSDSIETRNLEDEDDDYSFEMAKELTSRKCKTCNKVFKSYQALGGHMRNHKRVATRPVEKREFQCDICFKSFESGQALGGHKKVHWLTDTKNLMKVKNAPIVAGDDSDSDSRFEAATDVDESSSDTYDNYA